MASNAAIVKDVKQFEVALSALKAQADSIVVSDASTCLQAKTAQRDVRNYLKDVHSKLDPFVNLAKRTYDETRDERNRWITPGEEIDALLASKVKTYERQEREAAQREQDRINAENTRIAREKADAEAKAAKEAAEAKRKQEVKEINAQLKRGEIGKREAARLLKLAGDTEMAAKLNADLDAEEAKNAPPPTVTVQPAIPKVAGVPSRINYRAEVTDTFRFMEEAARRLLKGDNSLSRFLMVNGSAVALEAREMKDSKAFMAKYPFTKAWED